MYCLPGRGVHGRWGGMSKGAPGEHWNGRTPWEEGGLPLDPPSNISVGHTLKRSLCRANVGWSRQTQHHSPPLITTEGSLGLPTAAFCSSNYCQPLPQLPPLIQLRVWVPAFLRISFKWERFGLEVGC